MALFASVLLSASLGPTVLAARVSAADSAVSLYRSPFKDGAFDVGTDEAFFTLFTCHGPVSGAASSSSPACTFDITV
jgi:hypothetical protein